MRSWPTKKTLGEQVSDTCFVLAMGPIAVVMLILAFGLIMGMRGYVPADKIDCNERSGEHVNGGKYGDNFCVVDGLIVKVY